jgi:serine/threonine protein phosphatase PrpC
MALGIFDDAGYVQSEMDVHPGQALIIGTDGIWETHNPEGEMFGKDRLKDIIRNHTESPAAEIVDHIMSALDQFRYPLKKEDDVTLVVIKIIHRQAGFAGQQRPWQALAMPRHLRNSLARSAEVRFMPVSSGFILTFEYDF